MQLQTYHMQQVRKSRFSTENFFYLRYNAEGVTSRVSNTDDLSEPACYRQVHNLDQESEVNKGSKLYEDDYQIDLGIEFEDDDNVIIKRLSTLYPITNRPLFFDLNSNPTRPVDSKKTHHCLNELALFPTVHYRSLFLTQTYSPSGKYTLVTNTDGRFEVICVDDRIPINKVTYEPIWGLSYKNPWELLLIKAWAKKLKGYHKISQTKPFEFIENFSNPTWKYFNLTKSPEQFLHKYSNFSKSKHAKIILKSKDEGLLKEHGLLPNSASFEIVKGFTQVNPDKKEEAFFAIRGTSKSSWPGTLSYIDKSAGKAFQQIDPEISLERCFLITGDDLLNNFSAAYITSIRQDNYFTGYKILEIDADEKKAQYFEFEVPADGFFDFCIKQFNDNLIPASNQSRISVSTIHNGNRFLRNKYMLVRDNLGKHVSDFLKPSHSNEGAPPSMINSNLYVSNASQYRQPRFTVYEIEYLKGYNKGDAHFLHLDKGRYILRLKSQLTNKQARYSINWVSNSRIEIKQSTISKQEKVDLLHNAIVSVMHKGQNYSLENGKKTEMISYGNTFEEIGYGFVAVKSTISCPYSIILECNPQILAQQGYALKGKYKEQKEPFKIIIQKGEFDSVVLKLNKNADQYKWPTNAFKVWKKLQKAEGAESGVKIGEENVNRSNIQITESHIIRPSKQVERNDEEVYEPEAAQH